MLSSPEIDMIVNRITKNQTGPEKCPDAPRNLRSEVGQIKLNSVDSA